MKQKAKRVHISLATKDYEILCKKAELMGQKKSRVLRQLLHLEEAHNILELLHRASSFNTQMLLEISRVAGNINQIAYHLNAGFNVNEEHFERQAQETKRIFAEFHALAKQNQKLLARIFNA